jgi:hypothetical protein
MEKRGASGAVNFQRRTWDKEEYAQRAQERAEREAPGGSAYGAPQGAGAAAQQRPPVAGSAAAAAGGGGGGAGATVRDGRGEAAPYRNAEGGAAGPEGSKRAYLQARTEDLNLEAKVNKRKVVTDATPLSQVGGYFCELCQCTLTDSSTWLDHINGTKHQRRLGLSMRVEAASVDAVRARLQAVKEASAAAPAAERAKREEREALEEFAGRSATAEEEEKARKRAKREARKERQGGGSGGDGGCGGGGGGAALPAAAPVAEGATRGEERGAAGEGRVQGTAAEGAEVAAAGGQGGQGGVEGDGEELDMAAIMGFSAFGGGSS